MKSKVSKLIIVAVITGLIAVLGGCGDNGNAANSNEKRVIVDQLGKSVEIPAEIQRIVTLPIPMPSILYAVDGSGDRIVGMHPKSKIAVKSSMLAVMAPELMEDSVDFVKEGFTVNIEELMKLQPDVVFQWAHQPEEIEKIENAGIPVIAVKYGTQEDLEGWINIAGQLLDKEERAAELINYHHQILAEIESKAKDVSEEEKPDVFYLANTELGTAGTGTYNDFWMNLSGGINVASKISGWGKPGNMEQVLQWNPDIIYIGNFCELQPEDILQNRVRGQDWSQVNAVKNGRVYKVPLAGYRWDPPSVESPLMWKWLAQQHHPEMFNYSMLEELKNFYKKVYDYELSDQKAKEILNIES